MARSSMREGLIKLREDKAKQAAEQRAEAEKGKEKKRKETAHFFTRAGRLFSEGISKVKEKVNSWMDSAQEKVEAGGTNIGEKLAKLRGARNEASKFITSATEKMVDRSLGLLDTVARIDDAAANKFEIAATNVVNHAQERVTNLRAAVKEGTQGRINDLIAEVLLKKSERVRDAAQKKVEGYQNELKFVAEMAGARLDYNFDTESSPIMKQAREREKEILNTAADYIEASTEARVAAKEMKAEAAEKRRNGEVCGQIISKIAGTLEADGFLYSYLGLTE